MNANDSFECWLPVIIRISNEMPEDVTGNKIRDIYRWLENQLGTTMYSEYLPRNSKNDFPMSEEWVETLKLLDSPHWRTILKTYRIRKGLEHA